ncbi:hypothetical protein [Archangium violaceum]|uniref:hypothetical protein n=1 Tax=Archangium violaceum TaxID=83451 RepID=UPI0036D86C42
MGYTEAFKEQMVKRMLGPPAVSASALSKQVDVPQPRLAHEARLSWEHGPYEHSTRITGPSSPSSVLGRWGMPPRTGP